MSLIFFSLVFVSYSSKSEFNFFLEFFFENIVFVQSCAYNFFRLLFLYILMLPTSLSHKDFIYVLQFQRY